jgi:hypothetical protein
MVYENMNFGKNRWAYIMSAIIIVCISFLLIMRLSSQSRIDTILQQAQKSGQPITLDELESFYSRSITNAAPIYLQAFDLLSPKADDIPLVGSAKLPSVSESLREDLKIKIKKYLSENNDAIQLFHKAVEIEDCRYPLQLSKGIATPISHFTPLRQGVRILALKNCIALEENKIDEAVQTLLSMIHLSESMRNEPILISQLVRVACIETSLNALERTLSKHAISHAQLEQLASSISKTDSNEGAYLAMLGERCFGIDLFERNNLASTGTGLGQRQRVRYGFYKMTMGNRDYLFYLDTTTELVRISQLNDPYRFLDSVKLAKQTEKVLEGRSLLIFSKILLPSGSYLSLETRKIARIRCALSALHIEHFRLQNNRLPSDLSELVPNYIKEIPLDPFNGKPLLYLKQKKGYMVYSVGDDLADNRAKPKSKKASSKNDPFDIIFTVER